MFDHGVCPVCGRAAGVSCSNCGLRSVAFQAAVHGGTGELALAHSAIRVMPNWSGVPEVVHLGHAIAVRDWLRTEIGSLADHLRKRRRGQDSHTALETEVHRFGADAVLRAALTDLTPEVVEDACERFLTLAQPAMREGWRPGARPPPPGSALASDPAAPAAEQVTPTEKAALLAVLKRNGIRRVEDLERVTSGES